jgi:hypothetical protein
VGAEKRTWPTQLLGLARARWRVKLRTQGAIFCDFVVPVCFIAFFVALSFAWSNSDNPCDLYYPSQLISTSASGVSLGLKLFCEVPVANESLSSSICKTPAGDTAKAQFSFYSSGLELNWDITEGRVVGFSPGVPCSQPNAQKFFNVLETSFGNTAQWPISVQWKCFDDSALMRVYAQQNANTMIAGISVSNFEDIFSQRISPSNPLAYTIMSNQSNLAGLGSGQFFTSIQATGPNEDTEQWLKSLWLVFSQLLQQTAANVYTNSSNIEFNAAVSMAPTFPYKVNTSKVCYYSFKLSGERI